MMEQIHLLILAIILFGVGLYALLGKRNVIKILMGIEIMTISINVIFIALGANCRDTQRLNAVHPGNALF